MSKEPGREQDWYPISKLGWFTGHIREGVEVTRRQLELLQPARSRPDVLDDATVARIIRVHRDQAGDLTLFQNQAELHLSGLSWPYPWYGRPLRDPLRDLVARPDDQTVTDVAAFLQNRGRRGPARTRKQRPRLNGDGL